MINDENRSRPTSSKPLLSSTMTSVGRFYEKRHQWNGALDQYSQVLVSNPDQTALYIDRSRIFLKLGSIGKAHQDTDSALTLLDKNGLSSNLLLSYYVCLQKGEILYADGEFEFALMYFHRANKIKAGQQMCLDSIRKATEILQCTICNKNLHLTLNNNQMKSLPNDSKKKLELLHRPVIRRAASTVDPPLTQYTDRETNRLLIQVAKDRKLLIDLSKNNQSTLGFNGLSKAQIEARQTVSILESHLKFLDQAECLDENRSIQRTELTCSSKIERSTLLRLADDELKYLQELSFKDKSMEILYRAMKIVHCLQSFDSTDLRSRLILAEAFRFIGQSYREIHLYDQSCDYFRRAYDLIRHLNDSHCLYRATFDYGQSLILKKNFLDAIELFQRMIDETTNNHERTFLYQSISRCYIQLNDYEKAKQFAHQALDFALASNDELLSIECEILLSEIFLQLKDFSRADEYLQHVEQIKDQLGDLSSTTIERIHLTNDKTIERRSSSNFHWRILTPYPNLIDLCTREKKKKSRRNIGK